MSIPDVRDRVAQTAVLQYVEPVLQKEFEDCSFAYRRGRSVKMAVQRIREWAHGISATAESLHKKLFEGKKKIDMVRVAVRKIGNSYGSIGIAPLNP